jgi:hypothetical protein
MAEALRGRTAVVAGSTLVDEPTAPLSLVAEECAAGYGRDLLAYLLGAGAGAPLSAWRLDADTVDAGQDRLRVCYAVLQRFKEPRRARSWLRRTSTALSGRTFAWAVRTGEPGLLALVEREADRQA